MAEKSPSSSPKPSHRRVRMFSIMTYHSERDIQDCIAVHSQSIRAFAYIHHDKDETTPHYHLLIRTYDAWSSVQLSKWFDKYKAVDGQNTLIEPASDMQALVEYLTHGDLASIEAGKYRYNVEEIVDGGLLDTVEKKDSYDNTYEIINEMLKGVPTKVLIRRYGKQLIYHYSQFIAVKEAIEREEYYQIACKGKKDHTDVMPYGWHVTPPNNFEDIENLDDF